MFKLATILDNPGEPLAETRYRDPAVLRDLGYNGVVLYETTGLSGVAGVERIGDSEMRQWVASQFDLVRARIDAAHRADLSVFFAYDALSLARTTVEEMRTSNPCCHQAPHMLCPGSDAALSASVTALEALLDQCGPVAGVVLRVGDSDAGRLPHLIGNDVYQPHCARCSRLGRAERILRVAGAFHRLVVDQRGLHLILRAWNVRPNGMHDSVDLCRRVEAALPRDDRLVLSFKFTETDFWRYQRWNQASLVCGRRPVIYELECQREFEAKGAIPNWQVPLWCAGPPEVPVGDPHPTPAGLPAAAARVNLAGLWAWVRGGGWGGPFVTNETWIDANVFAVPRLAADPGLAPGDLARQWLRERLGVSDAGITESLERILTQSPQRILQGFYIGPFARARAGPWHPNADWIQDDVLEAMAAWRIVQELPADVLDEVVREKREAVDGMKLDHRALRDRMTDAGRGAFEPLLNTLEYGTSLFSTLRDLLQGLIAYRRWLEAGDPATARRCSTHLLDAERHWNQHTQRAGLLPGAATAFREVGFWELTQRIQAEVGAEVT